MAISIDWAARVINVPRADLTLVQVTPIEIRELDLNWFRLALRELEASVVGMASPHTHDHNAPVPLASFDVPRVVQLVNGYTWTPEDGQYVINVVGGNHNLGARRNPNQVSLSENLSAGLVQSREVETIAYNDTVYVHPTNGVSGIAFPNGTRRTPVNNLADAKLIAENRGLREIVIQESMTISGVDLSRYHVHCETHMVILTLDASATVEATQFMHGHLSGTTSSMGVAVENVHVHGVASAPAMTLRGCAVIGEIKPVMQLVMVDCRDESLTGVPGAGGGYPTINCESLGATGTLGGKSFVSISHQHGWLVIKNLATDSEITITIFGKLILEPTVTNGTVRVSGIGTVDDQSGGTAVVDTTGLLDPAKVPEDVWDEVRALTVGKFIGLT